jgi:hypothetical protein
VQARELTRVVPFCAQSTHAGTKGLAPTIINPAGGLAIEWDVADGITDVGQLLLGDYPGLAGHLAPLPHATGPFLDAAVYSVAHTKGEAGLLTVEYAIDRGCDFHLVTPGTAIPDSTFVNISGLRITGRFVRVTMSNPVTNADFLTVEFGAYVRSS